MISPRILYLFLLEYGKKHVLKAFFSLLGISLGVALFVSTTFNGRRAEKSLIDFSLGYLGEQYYLKIYHTNAQRGILDEEISQIYQHEDFRWIQKLVPRIQKTMYWKKESESYQVVYQGVDLLKEGIGFSNRNPKMEEREQLVFASSGLANLGLKASDTLEYRGEKISLPDLKYLETEGGLFLIEDIEQFRSRMGKHLPYSYILASVSDEYSPEKLRNLKKFLSSLDKGLEVETREDILQRSGNALKSFHLNLIIISMISVLIAFFMVSNTMTGLFHSRKKEMGVLRCLGVRSSEMIQLFLAQGIILGSIGTLLGIWLGLLFTKFSFFSGESTIADSGQTLSYTTIPTDILIYSILIGLFGSIISAVFPALRSARISPLLIVRETQEMGQILNSFSLFLFGLFLVLIAYPVAQIPSGFKIPVFGLLGIGMIVIGQTLQFPYLFKISAGLIRKILERFDSNFLTFRMGVEELFENASRNTLTAGTLMLATSLVLSLSMLTDSYKESIVSWTEREFPFPESIVNKKDIEESTGDGVDKKIYNEIKSLENISALDVFYLYTKLEIGDKIFTLHSYDFDLAIQKEKERGESSYPIMGEQDILISTNMAYLHGYQIGDRLTLPTKLGKQEFTIRGFREHFFSENGTIMMDAKIFEKYFQPEKYRALRLDFKDEKERQPTIQAINKILSSYPDLTILSAAQLRELYIRGTEKVFQVLGSLKYTACFIAGISLFSAILYSLQGKLRIFAMMRCLGGGAFQIGRVIFFEVFFLVLSGILAGILSAIFLGPIILFVINKNAFGWTLPIVQPYAFMIFFLGSAPFVAFLLTIYPVYILKRLSLREILSYE